MFGILASIAEFETALRRERQMEGIGSAKAKGETGGRPALVTPETKAEMVQLNAQGMSIRKIAARVGFSKATVQKAIAGREKAAAEDVLCQKLEYGRQGNRL